MNILVTGAGGFVGRELCRTLTDAGLGVRAAVRTPTADLAASQQITVGDIGPGTDWSAALRNIDTIAHLAARVHVMRDGAADPLQEFRKINVAATARLAHCAAEHGVRRLVFVSSIKVNGEQTSVQGGFSEADAPAPADPYGVSKWEAEQALYQATADAGIETVILRPPLVYGPGVRANFLQLMKLVARGLPLPFGRIDNRRSLIFIGNLTSALQRCLVHPNAANRVFLVADDEAVSTPELIRRLGLALHRPTRLFPAPHGLLRLAARLAGRTAALQRLTESLVVDSSHIRRLLGWSPPYSIDRGLAETAQWFCNASGS